MAGLRIAISVKVKGKVVPVLLTEHHATHIGEWKCNPTHFLNSALDGSEW